MSLSTTGVRAPAGRDFALPQRLSKPELVAISERLLAEPDIAVSRKEDVFRIRAAELDWDIGAIVYEPTNQGEGAIGPDGRRIGFFVFHGGASDFRSMERFSLLLAKKRGVRVVSLTYPGRFYFDDPQHNWPGDTFMPDGSARMPIWQRGEVIGRDQYDIVTDASLRDTYGTRPFARAKPGTPFWDRMAAWPLAMEAAIVDLCRRYFPPGEFSIYSHGHSTGGPFSHMLTQRVENAAGVAGIENSPFGTIWGEVTGHNWPNPFNDLLVRTWRELARYKGAELLKEKGPQSLMSLPAVIEDIFAAWEEAKSAPQFKAEYILHISCVPALTAAAEATARRLKLPDTATAALVERYLGYAKPLSGPGTKPVPPLLYIICDYSRDHTKENYFGIILPALARIDPAPKAQVVQFGTGVHSYWKTEPGLPMGCAAPAVDLLFDAIMSGYYLP